MRFRKLRIAWTVGWGLMVVLLIAIWLRSYWFVDVIYVARSHSVAWMQGLIFFDSEIYHNAPAPPVHHFGPVATRFIWNHHGVGVLSIYGHFIQIWLLAPFVIVVAVMPWVRQRFRLRTLLIVMTLLACLLGLGRWSASVYQRENPPLDWH
jgi:hypothetical protein